MAYPEYNDTIRFYLPNDPYYFEVDNLPLKELLENTDFCVQEIDAALALIDANVSKLSMRGGADGVIDAGYGTNDWWLNIYNMMDVNPGSVISAANNYVLYFNSTTKKWEAKPGVTTVLSLYDVVVPQGGGVSDGDILAYHSEDEKWHPYQLSEHVDTEDIWVSEHKIIPGSRAAPLIDSGGTMYQDYIWPAGQEIFYLTENSQAQHNAGGTHYEQEFPIPLEDMDHVIAVYVTFIRATSSAPDGDVEVWLSPSPPAFPQDEPRIDHGTSLLATFAERVPGHSTGAGNTGDICVPVYKAIGNPNMDPSVPAHYDSLQIEVNPSPTDGTAELLLGDPNLGSWGWSWAGTGGFYFTGHYIIKKKISAIINV